MRARSGKPNVIVLGAGAAGIAMAHQLRYGLRYDNFMVSCLPLSKKIQLSSSIPRADLYHRYMRRTLESEAHGFKILILDGELRQHSVGGWQANLALQWMRCPNSTLLIQLEPQPKLASRSVQPETDSEL